VLFRSASGGVQLVAVPEQPVGYFYQAQAGMGGMSAELWKDVTYNGETTSEHINSSTYQAAATVYEVGTAGASDALLQAIYANDLAAAQAAAAGVPQTSPTTQPSTEAPTDSGVDTNVPTTPDTQVPSDQGNGDGTASTPDSDTGDGTIPVDPSAGGGQWVDTPDGEIYVEGSNGVTVW